MNILNANSVNDWVEVCCSWKKPGPNLTRWLNAEHADKPANDECFLQFCAVPIDKLLCGVTHARCHVVTHLAHARITPLGYIRWSSPISMAATEKYRLRVCLRQLPLITLDWVAHSLFVCVCVSEAPPSPASFSAWCSWWGRWRPCSCACACAWRTGGEHASASSAPPTSTLWARATQVGQGSGCTFALQQHWVAQGNENSTYWCT